MANPSVQHWFSQSETTKRCSETEITQDSGSLKPSMAGLCWWSFDLAMIPPHHQDPLTVNFAVDRRDTLLLHTRSLS